MEEKELTKTYYRIREVSEMLNVPHSTLRFWEQEFPQLKPKRNDKGTRFYTPDDIATLRQIKFLVHDKGLKLEAAKQEMRVSNASVVTRQKAIERLEEIRATLEEMRAALTRRSV